MATKEKALRINLDRTIYGTFAEIGAGQEVARYFFQVGGASGTVAKTMSAYDMVVSDSIYGPEPSGRYVCESRLQTMLTREFDLLVDRLRTQRDSDSRFFVFANTIATSAYGSTDPGHGWLGVRFQNKAGEEASQIKIHVRLLGHEAVLQQKAVGILGVNLMHAAFFGSDNLGVMIHSLVDELNDSRVVVDCLRCSGPAFEGVDDRLLQLELIKADLSHAILISPDGMSYPPSELLYKKHVLALRGTFRPFTLRDQDKVSAGERLLKTEEGVDANRVIRVCDISLDSLRDLADQEIIGKYEMIHALGHHVMVSNFGFPYQLVDFLDNFSQKLRGLVLSRDDLQTLFQEEPYTDLRGGMLEAFGILLNGRTQIYLYPSVGAEGNLQCERLEVLPKYNSLAAFFRQSGYLRPIVDYNSEHAKIDEMSALEAVQTRNFSMVSPQVRGVIEQRKLF